MIPKQNSDILLQAVFNEDLETVRKLIANGAILNFVNQNGVSPLIIAIETQNEELVKLLLKNGADPNFKTGVPSLHSAIDSAVESAKNNDDVREDNTSIIKILLAYGADINVKDKENRTAYEFAKNYHVPAQRLFEGILKNRKP